MLPRDLYPRIIKFSNNLSRTQLTSMSPRVFSKSAKITSRGLRPILVDTVGKNSGSLIRPNVLIVVRTGRGSINNKKHTLQSIRRTHWNYVNSILQERLELNDPKPFWRYVKSNQQDSVGVAFLKLVDKLYLEAKDKADILNKQYKFVFTPAVPGCWDTYFNRP